MVVEALQYKEEINRELNKILTHSLFKGARRSSSFLRYVCDKTLSGESHQIKEFSIAIDAFGLEMTFDQQMDPRIRVEAKRLRDRLKQYYEGPGCQDTVVIQMEKGSYIPCFLITDSHAEKKECEENREEEDRQTVLLDKRFLIHFDLPDTTIEDHQGAGLLESQIVHQLFLQGQKESRDLPLSELLSIQKAAFSLVLIMRHHCLSDKVHFILRLKLKDLNTLIHSKNISVSVSDLKNEEKVKSIVLQESEELVNFCRSVQS